VAEPAELVRPHALSVEGSRVALAWAVPGSGLNPDGSDAPTVRVSAVELRTDGTVARRTPERSVDSRGPTRLLARLTPDGADWFVDTLKGEGNDMSGFRTWAECAGQRFDPFYEHPETMYEAPDPRHPDPDPVFGLAPGFTAFPVERVFACATLRGETPLRVAFSTSPDAPGFAARRVRSVLVTVGGFSLPRASGDAATLTTQAWTYPLKRPLGAHGATLQFPPNEDDSDTTPGDEEFAENLAPTWVDGVACGASGYAITLRVDAKIYFGWLDPGSVYGVFARVPGNYRSPAEPTLAWNGHEALLAFVALGPDNTYAVYATRVAPGQVASAPRRITTTARAQRAIATDGGVARIGFNAVTVSVGALSDGTWLMAWTEGATPTTPDGGVDAGVAIPARVMLRRYWPDLTPGAPTVELTGADGSADAQLAVVGDRVLVAVERESYAVDVVALQCPLTEPESCAPAPAGRP
jgi:hypothetical protein